MASRKRVSWDDAGVEDLAAEYFRAKRPTAKIPSVPIINLPAGQYNGEIHVVPDFSANTIQIRVLDEEFDAMPAMVTVLEYTYLEWVHVAADHRFVAIVADGWLSILEVICQNGLIVTCNEHHLAESISLPASWSASAVGAAFPHAWIVTDSELWAFTLTVPILHRWSRYKFLGQPADNGLSTDDIADACWSVPINQLQAVSTDGMQLIAAVDPCHILICQPPTWDGPPGVNLTLRATCLTLDREGVRFTVNKDPRASLLAVLDRPVPSRAEGVPYQHRPPLAIAGMETGIVLDEAAENDMLELTCQLNDLFVHTGRNALVRADWRTDTVMFIKHKQAIVLHTRSNHWIHIEHSISDYTTYVHDWSVSCAAARPARSLDGILWPSNIPTEEHKDMKREAAVAPAMELDPLGYDAAVPNMDAEAMELAVPSMDAEAMELAVPSMDAEAMELDLPNPDAAAMELDPFTPPSDEPTNDEIWAWVDNNDILWTNTDHCCVHRIGWIPFTPASMMFTQHGLLLTGQTGRVAAICTAALCTAALCPE